MSKPSLQMRSSSIKMKILVLQQKYVALGFLFAEMVKRNNFPSECSGVLSQPLTVTIFCTLPERNGLLGDYPVTTSITTANSVLTSGGKQVLLLNIILSKTRLRLSEGLYFSISMIFSSQRL